MEQNHQTKRQKVGILNPQPHQLAVFEELSKEYQIVPILPARGDWSKETRNYWVQFCKKNGISGVVGLSHHDAFHHVIINSELGVNTVKPYAHLTAMNKYMMRTVEPKAFWFTSIDPDREPDNNKLIARVPENEWPVMLKSTSLSLGRGVYCCPGKDKMAQNLNLYRQNAQMKNEVKSTNESILQYMTPEQIKQAGSVPPFLAEHCINLNKGWTEYWVQGCVMEDGQVVPYVAGQEVFMKGKTSIGYVTPPMRYQNKDAPIMNKFVQQFMAQMVKRGFRRQFFNVQFFGSFDTLDGNPQFHASQINPRCYHTYHSAYRLSSGCIIFKDVIQCVINNKKPENTPWKQWCKGDKIKTAIQVNITVKGSAGKRVDEVIDSEYVERLAKDQECKLIRYVKKFDDIISEEDANSAPGAGLLEITIATATKQEVAAKQMGLRKNLYKIKQEDQYPDFWLQLASKYKGPLGIFSPSSGKET